MALVSLKMSKKDMAEESAPTQSEYPYGVCLRLDTDELEKLGIKTLPNVGDEYHIRAVGEVTSVSESDAQGGPRRGMEVQIQMMELENEGEEGSDSVAEEEAEDAEGKTVGGTVLHNAYRGRK